jgi:hypothetical protein
MRMISLGRICRRNKNSDRSSIVETPVGVRRFRIRGVKAFHILGGRSDAEDGILTHRVWEIGVVIVVDSLEEEELVSEEGGGRGAYPPRSQAEQRELRGMFQDRAQQEQRKGVMQGKSSMEGMDKNLESAKCFRCGEVGHHQMQCSNDPVCYKCKKSGHMAAECGGRFAKTMKMFGFGVPGQGFYSFEIPEKGIMSKLSGLIVVQEGEASEKKLLEELKHLVRNDWDFQIKQIAEKEYRVAFPDQGSLDTLSKMTGIQLALYGLKIKIIKINVDPAASSILQSTWVKIVGIPGFAKEEEVVKEIASLVG